MRPDPGRPFWSLATERPGRKTGPWMRLHPAGSDVPPEAVMWCHEGDPEWTRVTGG